MKWRWSQDFNLVLRPWAPRSQIPDHYFLTAHTLVQEGPSSLSLSLSLFLSLSLLSLVTLNPLLLVIADLPSS